MFYFAIDQSTLSLVDSTALPECWDRVPLLHNET
jgi:hypothetical protein